ncbi:MULTISPECIES: DUF7576 family protein [Haladaptatus]|uniref:Small CPxCG-related zinc finger protein n=3 Tax=Haladaptatus TaxID=367188 RepID=A0A1M6VB41_HALPU|nr:MULTISPECIES: hypothetical protein [Haladaptatus]GKZ13943.1 hypothetical protein HAL_18240 [Haladaptatus sp. T7]SHK78678.1 hypothetical protein SAMN05444342_2177 [Haladaptatus paucihalophilus DX253]
MNDTPGMEKRDGRRDVTITRSVTPVCSHCDRPIDTTAWYPIVTETKEDGSVVLHSFCDETCQAAWSRQ